MSPTLEVSVIFRHSMQEWEDLGQHGQPPQTSFRSVIRWVDLRGICQYNRVMCPNVNIPDREPACVLTTTQGDLIVLEDYDKLWKQWDRWEREQRKPKPFDFGNLKN